MKNLKICVIGLGYVGLPLALNFAKNNILTIGLDINKLLINDLKKNISRITSVKNTELKNIANKNKLSFSNEYSEIPKSTYIIICVPTPLKKDKPDLSYVISTCNSLLKHIKKGQTIIFESTSYPGTTRKVISKILSKGKLKAEKDFYVCFSPERENPGMTSILYKDIPKLTDMEKTANAMGHSVPVALKYYVKHSEIPPEMINQAYNLKDDDSEETIVI